MPLFAPRCAKARFLSAILLVALSREAASQADERDAVIQDLRRRLDEMEKKVGEKPPPPPPPAAAPVPPVVAPAPAVAPPPAVAPAPAAASPAPAAAAPAAAPKPKPAAPTPGASEEAGAADEGGRALERALVREGGLVLPRRVVEIEPRFQYTYRNTQGLNVAVVNGLPQVAQQDVRRDDLELSLAIRAGLSNQMQVDVRLPYVRIDQNRATGPTVSESEQVSGWGDVELGLTRQLTAGRRGGLLGSLSWKPPTGEHQMDRLSPGTGFHQLQAAITAVMREDPLVFFLSPSYTWIFKRNKSGIDVDPGDAAGLKAGTLLAASPETSLRASLELSRAGRTKLAGQGVAGSDTMSGILELGLAKVLTQRTLLDVQLGIGITPDAPDFRLRIAVPIRFGP